jgi:hypothetical protein
VAQYVAVAQHVAEFIAGVEPILIVLRLACCDVYVSEVSF